jgi:hypothetical protein
MHPSMNLFQQHRLTAGNVYPPLDLWYNQVMTKVAEYHAIHKCVICGNSFEADNPRSTMCDDCHYAKCPICGDSFYRTEAKRITCSRSCGSKHAAINRTRTELTCQFCGKAFYPKSGHLKIKYCSKKCRYNSMRKPDSDKKRSTSRYRTWRKSVIKRDKYTCQICGSTKYLQSHHLKSWEDHPKLRYKVINGQTLCKFCHSKIHNKPITQTQTHRINCEDCGAPITGRGKSNYCRSCSLKHSSKAQKNRSFRLRNEDGRFTS